MGQFSGMMEELDGANDRIRQLKAEIDRLRAERDDFAEQLAMRQPSALEKDMQEIMRINNRLRTALEEIAGWLLPTGRDAQDVARRALTEKE